MFNTKAETKSNWECVSQSLKNQHPIKLDSRVADLFSNSPQTMLNILTFYKIVAKLSGKKKRILDVNCQEGFGTYLLAKECGFAKGVSASQRSIQWAMRNFQLDDIEFEYCKNVLKYSQEVEWDVIVYLDRKNCDSLNKYKTFLKNFSGSLPLKGFMILGVSQQRDSCANFKSEIWVKSLQHEISQIFNHVFLFSISNEIMQAGYTTLSDRLLFLACKRRKTPEFRSNL